MRAFVELRVGVTMFDQLACRIDFQKLGYEGRYTPPSLRGTLVYSDNFGTFNWYMGPFLGPLKIPCQAPPWGYVAAADLRTGKIAYKLANGTVYDMTPLPLPFTVGVPGIGGPMITRGGVAFLGAAVDDFLRAYDLKTGRELWRGRLPAGGQSTPMTYLDADDLQIVLIVAGGHGSVGTKPGDYVIAYPLPTQ